jgi:hypothetical protein
MTAAARFEPMAFVKNHSAPFQSIFIPATVTDLPFRQPPPGFPDASGGFRTSRSFPPLPLPFRLLHRHIYACLSPASGIIETENIIETSSLRFAAPAGPPKG